MKRDGIEAATKLLELKLINEQQFAELVIKSLNGHAAPAIQQQLPMRKAHSTNNLSIEQIEALIDMHIQNTAATVIAANLNNRFGLKLSVTGVKSIIRDIRNGKKARALRYQTPEWRAAFAKWQAALA